MKHERIDPSGGGPPIHSLSDTPRLTAPMWFRREGEREGYGNSLVNPLTMAGMHLIQDLSTLYNRWLLRVEDRVSQPSHIWNFYIIYLSITGGDGEPRTASSTTIESESSNLALEPPPARTLFGLVDGFSGLPN